MTLKHRVEDRHTTGSGLRGPHLEWGTREAQTFFMIHGFSSNAHAFDQTADALCDRFHVIAPDQRGHGDTDWASDGYDRHKYVEDLTRFVEGLGAKRFVLLGHSMGGMNVIEYAARHPQEVERLIILDIGPEIVKAGISRIRKQSGQGPEEFESVEEVFKLMRSQDPTPPDEELRHRAQYAVKQLANGKWGWKYDKVLRSPQRPIRRAAPPTVLWDMLGQIPCPTLVIRGETSDILSRETAQRMVEVLPNGKWVEVPGAGHRVPLDNLPGFLAVLRDYLGV